MKNKLSFIHAADIHLGSFLHISNKINDQAQNIIDRAVFSAFEQIVNKAIENSVDFLVISGDIFESGSKSISAVKFFNDMMKKLKNIEVYVICGNHDPYREWMETFKLPINVHMLGCEEVENYDYKKDNIIACRIKGISYRTKKENREMLPQFRTMDDGVPGIALFHSQLDASNTFYMPASSAEMLATKGIFYWALGHIHKLKIINKCKPCAAYPGIPQGRDFGEDGIGGCLLVKINHSEDISLEYLPTSSVVFEKIEINLDEDDYKEIQDITDIEDIITGKAEKLVFSNLILPGELICTASIESEVKGFVVQWILKGRGKIHKLISGKEDDIGSILIQNLNNRLGYLSGNKFIHTDSIVFRTSAELPDIKELTLKSSIYEELKSVTEAYLKNNALKQEIVEAFGDIWDGKSDMEDEDPLKFHLDDEILENIIKQAQDLAIEKIYERGDS